MRQEVIIYRTPAETYLWDHPEIMLWIVGSCVGSGLVIWVISKVIERRNRNGYATFKRGAAKTYRDLGF